jgi:hypothetical protein
VEDANTHRFDQAQRLPKRNSVHVSPAEEEALDLVQSNDENYWMYIHDLPASRCLAV